MGSIVALRGAGKKSGSIAEAPAAQHCRQQRTIRSRDIGGQGPVNAFNGRIEIDPLYANNPARIRSVTNV